MRKLSALLLLSFLLFFCVHRSESNPQQKPLVFVHVTVIDATGVPAMPDMTVTIIGNQITAIGKTGIVSVPAEAEVVEAAGKFLIPGLCDMHVHLFNHVREGPSTELYFPMLIANGITSVRDMWTKLDEIPQVQQWRKQLDNGTATIPRIAAAGTLIDGPVPIWPGADTVATAGDARRMVDKLNKAGIDFIKVYWNLPRNSYFAIADECKKLRIPFAGHVPFSISAREASDSGQKSIEHFTEIPITCSAREAEFRKIKPEDWGPKNEEEVLESYDEKKCEKLFSRFVKNKTWQVPTLVMYHRTIVRESELLNDERLKYIPASERETWKSFNEMMNERSAEQVNYAKRLWKTHVKLISGMRRAGVQFMAGTDMGNAMSYLYPGFSLHDELALLVQTGFTPMEALQTATRNPAQFLERLDSIGTIEKGKIADLVLLDANPLEDIRNTRKIDAAVLNGKLIRKDGLQKMLADLETAAIQKN
jgi:imidazolonepropionase-like amidohydrolase